MSAALEKKSKELEDELSGARSEGANLAALNSELTVQLSGIQGEKERLVADKTKRKEQLAILSEVSVGGGRSYMGCRG